MSPTRTQQLQPEGPTPISCGPPDPTGNTSQSLQDSATSGTSHGPTASVHQQDMHTSPASSSHDQTAISGLAHAHGVDSSLGQSSTSHPGNHRQQLHDLSRLLPHHNAEVVLQQTGPGYSPSSQGHLQGSMQAPALHPHGLRAGPMEGAVLPQMWMQQPVLASGHISQSPLQPPTPLQPLDAAIQGTPAGAQCLPGLHEHGEAVSSSTVTGSEDQAAGPGLSEQHYISSQQQVGSGGSGRPHAMRANMAQDSTRRLIDAQQEQQHQPLELLDLPPTLLARAQDTHRL